MTPLLLVFFMLHYCENCFMSIMTMKAGIEQAIKNRLPQMTQVEAINGIEMP